MSSSLAPASLNYAELAKLRPTIISGAHWFWWIAGMSLVNTIMIHSGSEMSFIIGLGFTLVADAMFKEMPAIAFAIDACALLVFFGFGWFAKRGHFWAFVTGAVLYTLDAGIYVLFQDWMATALHGLGLYYIIRGAIALREVVKAAKAEQLAEPPTIPPIVPASS
jgi:hypothetical protein